MIRLLLTFGAAVLLASPVTAQVRDTTLAAQVKDTTLKLDAVVAMVGNVPITVYDIERRLGDSLAAFARRGAGIPTRPVQLAMANSALNDLVDEEVLLYKAKEAGIEISDAEVAAEMENFMREVSAQYPSQAQFRQALLDAGFGTPEEFRRTRTTEYRRAQTIGRYVNQLRSEKKIPSVVVSEAEVKKEYDRYKAAGALARREYRVGFRQMVIAPAASAEEKAKARAKADSLRAEIRAGGDFERIAKRESMDVATKEAGGDLGWRKRGDLPVELERLLFGPLALRQGDVSQVIESPFGYHLLRIDRSNPPAEVKVRHILVIPRIDSVDVTRARTLADSLAGAMRRGAVFDTVARLYHDRAEDAAGLIPEMPIDSLPQTYQAGLKDVKKDSIVSFPIDNQKFVIAQVESTSEPGEFTFDEIKSRIRMQLQQVLQLRKYLDEQRKTVYVRLYPERAEEAIRIFATAPGR